MLTYAQQSKEKATIEQDRLAKRTQEFMTETEMKEAVPNNLAPVSVNGVGMSSDKNIDAIMQSTTKGTVSKNSQNCVFVVLQLLMHYIQSHYIKLSDELDYQIIYSHIIKTLLMS